MSAFGAPRSLSSYEQDGGWAPDDQLYGSPSPYTGISQQPPALPAGTRMPPMPQPPMIPPQQPVDPYGQGQMPGGYPPQAPVAPKRANFFWRNRGKLGLFVGAILTSVVGAALPTVPQSVHDKIVGAGGKATTEAVLNPNATPTDTTILQQAMNHLKHPVDGSPAPTVVCSRELPERYPKGTDASKFEVVLGPASDETENSGVRREVCLDVSGAQVAANANGETTAVFPLKIIVTPSMPDDKVTLANTYDDAAKNGQQAGVDESLLRMTQQAQLLLIEQGAITDNTLPQVGLVLDAAALQDPTKATKYDTWKR